jgi:hypothetical protein
MELWMPEYGVGHGIWMATGYLFAFILVVAPLYFAVALRREHLWTSRSAPTRHEGVAPAGRSTHSGKERKWQREAANDG